MADDVLSVGKSISLPPSPLLSAYSTSFKRAMKEQNLNLSEENKNLENQQQPLIHNFDASSFIRKTLSNYTIRDLDKEENCTNLESNCDAKQCLVGGCTKRKCGIIETHTCIYCGCPNEILKFEPSSKDTPHNSTLDDLYCQSCRKLFIERSKSDIQRMLLDQQQADQPASQQPLLNSANTNNNLVPPPKKGRYSKKGSKTYNNNNPTATLIGKRSTAGVEKICRAQSSWSSCSSLKPLCRICQLPSEMGRSLINPCRCKGTMQFVHSGCLVRWLEISYHKGHAIPQCELCGYHFRMHHCVKIKRLFFPRCPRKDKFMHLIFFMMATVMLGCAVLSAVYLRTEKTRIRKALTAEDVAVILSSLVFFCAFFVAVFTQYRARYSLCHLLYRFWLINRRWRVKDYNPLLDRTDDKSGAKVKHPWRQTHPQYNRQQRVVSDV